MFRTDLPIALFGWSKGAMEQNGATMTNPKLEGEFLLTKQSTKVTLLALVSLKTALRAYFTSYASLRHYWAYLTGQDTLSETEQERLYTIEQIYRYGSSYYEHYAEAIAHFQHFAELTFSDLLRQGHPRLAKESDVNHVTFWQSIKNTPSTNDDFVGNTISFTHAGYRLAELAQDPDFGKGELHFFNNTQRLSLERLKDRRNDLLHRGTTILRYGDFDQLIGVHVLPFVYHVLRLSSYNDAKKSLWEHKPIHARFLDGSQIDPLAAILSVFQSGYDIQTVALFKEMGRAAYHNPLPLPHQLKGFGSSQYKHIQPDKEKQAEALVKEHEASEVRTCPVCGAKTLLVYEGSEYEDFDEETGPEHEWQFTYAVECVCCTFHIDHNFKNLSEYGIDVEDYW